MDREQFKAIIPALNYLTGKMFSEHFDNIKGLRTETEGNLNDEFFEYKVYIPTTIKLKEKV